MLAGLLGAGFLGLLLSLGALFVYRQNSRRVAVLLRVAGERVTIGIEDQGGVSPHAVWIVSAEAEGVVAQHDHLWFRCRDPYVVGPPIRYDVPTDQLAAWEHLGIPLESIRWLEDAKGRRHSW